MSRARSTRGRGRRRSGPTIGFPEHLVCTGGRRRGAFAAVLPVLLAGGLSLADGPPAGPSGGALACGAVVTRDVMLSSDLRGCHGDGLVVGADGVTVDLGGHTVSGDGRAGSPDADTGIRVVGHRDVRIVHGTVSRFDVGIGGSSAPRLAVTEVTVGDTHRGVAVADGSHDAKIEDSRFVAIGDAAGGAAVLVLDSSRARVVRNVMRQSHSGVAVTAAGATVADNVVTDSSFAGVELTFATGGRVSGNTIRGAACGICLEGADRNTVGHNVITGLTAPDGIGISLYGSGNDVLANRVTGSVRYAIEVDDFQEAGHTPVSGNDVRDNVVRGGPASVDGIAVGPEGGGTVLRTAVIANRVTGFSDDGIRIGGASSGLETTRVAGNTVVGSGNLAIEAVPGVADGGGNRALRTGSLVPCLGVACRSTGPRVESFVYTTAAAGDVQAVWGADRSGAHQITEPGAVCCLGRLALDARRMLVMPGGDPGVPVTGQILDLRTHRLTRIPLQDPTLNLVPQAWSPDGTRIAFEGWDDTDPARTGVYTARASDGGDLRRVTTRHGAAHDIPLDYSPDGRRLVVFRATHGDENGDLDGSLWVVGIDGAGAHRVTATTAPPAPWARWSPDGSRILFATERLRPNGAVWTVRPDGTGARILFRDPAGRHPVSPTWTADGRHIIVALDPTDDEFQHPENALYLLDADGSGLRLLLGSHDVKRYPEIVPRGGHP